MSDDDSKDGATGILNGVTTDKPATFEITAVFSYDWLYAIQAYGPFSGAVAKGGVDMAAFRNGSPIDGPRRAEIFSDSIDTLGRTDRTGNGMIEARVTFDIMPGEVVGVPFGVWLHCDHDSGWGTAGAGELLKLPSRIFGSSNGFTNSQAFCSASVSYRESIMEFCQARSRSAAVSGLRQIVRNLDSYADLAQFDGANVGRMNIRPLCTDSRAGLQSHPLSTRRLTA